MGRDDEYTTYGPYVQSKIQCYKCLQFGHKANNPRCPLFNQKRPTNDDSGSDMELKPPHRPPAARPKDPWKYIEPRDLSKPCKVDGKKWYFCAKCKCWATGKVGFYQLSHTDETQDPN